MIKLRVVGSSEDHAELILSNKPRGKRGTHTVAIDKKLLGVLQDAVYGRRQLDKNAAATARALEPRMEPRIPPREIQRQLRAGLSPARVARAAAVDEAYVDQFYPPILYERAGVIQDAHVLHLEKPRLGRSGLPLGEAVEANLAARRVALGGEALANAWTATRQDGQPWTILLTFPFRGRSRTARWRYDARTRELTPANKLAADVGWVAPGARPSTAKTASTRPAVRRAPARKRTAKKTVRKPPAKKRAPARKRTAKKRAPARKRPAKKTARKRPAARRAPARKRAAARRRPARRR